MSAAFELWPIGKVESPLTDPAAAPKQVDEGGPAAWIVFDPALVPAADGLNVGDEILVLTWLHLARRDILRVHPRSDTSRPEQGVFSTRSPDRPNPIGLHQVEIIAVEHNRLRVRNLEAIDGTPVVDLKPVLGKVSAR